MALVNTAVLLFAAPGNGNLNLPHDRWWYDRYFFHPLHGHAGYWMTQSSGDRVLYGQVFDWIAYQHPSPDFSSRTDTANLVISLFERDQGVSFDAFDVVVVVLGIAPHVPSDGGSTGAKSNNRKHNAVVIRVGDSFDFVAHELGHALGLSHSFGANPVVVVGDNPGGYGHPFCIMSAQIYGGTAAAYAPTVPRDNAPEYSGLGPSLNGLTARAHGWIDTHTLHLGATPQGEFTIRARQWLGRTAYAAPQGLQIIAADGTDYVVDFYEPLNWDLAQPGPALVLTQGRGGLAHFHYPSANSGTYLSHVRLPVTFGSAGAALRGANFTVEPLDYNPTTHEARIRVRPGVGGTPGVEVMAQLTTLASRTVEGGVTTWASGEALCLSGEWSYEKVARSQEAVLDATYLFGSPGMTAQWTVEGMALPSTAIAASSSLTMRIPVSFAHPKFQKDVREQFITLEYSIDPLSNGSRLRIRNQPADESFRLRIEVQLSSRVGSGSAITWVQFTGHQYVYPAAFDEAREACLNRFIDVGKRYRPYKVVIFPQLWEQVPPMRQLRLASWLEALAEHWERGERRVYEQAMEALALELETPDLGIQVLSTREAHRPPRIDHEIPPPAQPGMPGGSLDGPGHAPTAPLKCGYLVAGVVGAGLAILGMLLLRRRDERERGRSFGRGPW